MRLLCALCFCLSLWHDLGNVVAEQAPALMRKKLNDGTEMPILGLGTWKSPKGEVEAAVRHALCKAGYRHIDAAQIYQNQQEVGRGIAYALEQCGLAREELWVTSKIWMVDFDPKDVLPAVDRILQELGLTYVDQVLLHWPVPLKKPPVGCPPDCPPEFGGTDNPERPRGPAPELRYVTADIPLTETWKRLIEVKESGGGKIRSIGVSNFNVQEVQELVRASSTPPAVNQVEAHVFWSQLNLRQEMKKLGIALVAYSPLGNPGLYSAKLEGMNSDLVQGVAADMSLEPAQVMLSFLTTLGDIVVPKSVTPSRIESNAHFPLTLSDATMAKLYQAPQARMTNPTLREGHLPVFVDEDKKSKKANEL